MGAPQRTGASQVSLLIARLDPCDLNGWIDAAQRWLTRDERDRAAGMTPRARSQHVVGRALLRLVAATAAGLEPATVEVVVTDGGKPELTHPKHLNVSVAHTVGLVILAWSAAAPVGVDVESPSRFDQGRHGRLAQRFFSDREVQALGELEPAQVGRAFLRHWTLKEAVGKALGEGVVPAFDGAVFDVPVNGHARLLWIWTEPMASQWTIHELTAPNGDELIAVALPLSDVGLGPVQTVELQELAQGLVRTCADATR